MKTLLKIIFVLVTFLTFTTTRSQAEDRGDEDDVSVILKKSQSAAAHVSANEDSSSRKKKILNIFDVVRFPNGACMSSSAGKNGTCYAQDECENKGGTGYGSCAGGYGVCCVFTLTCGQQSSENCSYFQSVGGEIGECRVKICPCREHICQLRLDFGSFVINGPSTLAASVATIIAKKDAFPQGQCNMDQFKVTSGGNHNPPMICGVNSGEHMYVDASELCNDLAFTLGPSTSEELARAGLTTAATRTWNIKITQYDCNYNNLAPDGCTQYYWGATSDVVRTYNWGGTPSRHLADQNQNICIRRERGVCRMCFAQQANADFQLSGGQAVGGNGFMSSQCCGYGSEANKNTNGFDCVMIPGATKAADKADLNNGAAFGFCGGQLASINANANAATICTMQVPFSIRFISDHYEFTNEVAQNPLGFRLTYMSQTC